MGYLINTAISLFASLSSGQKPIYTLKMLISEQIAFAAVLHFEQFFVSAGSSIKACWNGFY